MFCQPICVMLFLKLMCGEDACILALLVALVVSKGYCSSANFLEMLMPLVGSGSFCNVNGFFIAFSSI